MVKKTYSLEEVLSSGSLVLMDTSAGRTPHELDGSWYAREIFNTKSFYSINSDGLRLKFKEAFIAHYISRFFQTRTVPEVPAEVWDFVKILQKKLDFLNQNYEWAKKEKRRDVPKDYNQKCEEVKNNFEELCFYTTQLANRTQKVCLTKHLATPEYKTIFRIAGYVAAQPEIMRNINERYPRLYIERKRDKEADRKRRLRTDQRIAATAFYLAVYEGQQVRIITGDSHIGRLVRGMKETIKVSPNFADIKAKISGNCPQVYFSVTGFDLVREA